MLTCAVSSAGTGVPHCSSSVPHSGHGSRCADGRPARPSLPWSSHSQPHCSLALPGKLLVGASARDPIPKVLVSLCRASASFWLVSAPSVFMMHGWVENFCQCPYGLTSSILRKMSFECLLVLASSTDIPSAESAFVPLPVDAR